MDKYALNDTLSTLNIVKEEIRYGNSKSLYNLIYKLCKEKDCEILLNVFNHYYKVLPKKCNCILANTILKNKKVQEIVKKHLEDKKTEIKTIENFSDEKE